jgi:hypothetical protein
VAWTIGRTETVDYTAKYGQVAFEKENLTGGIEKLTEGLDYAIEIYNGNSWQTVFNSTTGVIVFNMPVSDYNIGNNCFSRIIPVDSGSFLQWNASAPVCQIFTRQVAPMNDGSFSRIVAVPTVRALNSTLNTANGNLNCYTFYLPLLNDTSNPYLSQSVTLIGANLTNLNYLTPNGVNNCQVRIDATAIDNTSTGFNNAFFNFPSTSETTSIPSNSMIEIYIGTVDVSIGMAS